MDRLRLTEVLGAVSLTTDLGSGLPFEKGLTTSVLAGAFSDALDLGLPERRAVFHTALLRAIGCTAHASENAAMFLDDLAFQRAFKLSIPPIRRRSPLDSASGPVRASPSCLRW
jgi:hypothetical protein